MKTALIVIDFQMDYFPGGVMELVDAEQTGEKARHLLAQCRHHGLEVVHLQHLSTRPGATFFLPETRGVDIHKSLSPLAAETVVTKQYPNGFRETGLADLLRRQKVGRLIFCGMMSHMCVDATVRAAFDLGFECLVAHDSCTTRDLSFGKENISASQVHGAFMAALDGVYAQVVTTQECMSLVIE